MCHITRVALFLMPQTSTDGITSDEKQHEMDVGPKHMKMKTWCGVEPINGT